MTKWAPDSGSRHPPLPLNRHFYLSSHWCIDRLSNGKHRMIYQITKYNRKLRAAVDACAVSLARRARDPEDGVRVGGPERGGLFLCRLQPLTQRKCLPLCHAASHSGSS